MAGRWRLRGRGGSCVGAGRFEDAGIFEWICGARTTLEEVGERTMNI